MNHINIISFNLKMKKKCAVAEKDDYYVTPENVQKVGLQICNHNQNLTECFRFWNSDDVKEAF